MSLDLEARRRRAVWRASHRGTKEMDWLLGRFAEARVAAMDVTALTRFEQLLALSDPDLQRWFIEGTTPSGEFAPEIEAVRAFHGVG